MRANELSSSISKYSFPRLLLTTKNSLIAAAIIMALTGTVYYLSKRNEHPPKIPKNTSNNSKADEIKTEEAPFDNANSAKHRKTLFRSISADAIRRTPETREEDDETVYVMT